MSEFEEIARRLDQLIAIQQSMLDAIRRPRPNSVEATMENAMRAAAGLSPISRPGPEGQ